MTDDDALVSEDPSCSLALIIVSVIFSVCTLEVMIKVLGPVSRDLSFLVEYSGLHRNIWILDRSRYHIRQVLRLKRNLSVRSENSTTLEFIRLPSLSDEIWKALQQCSEYFSHDIL